MTVTAAEYRRDALFDLAVKRPKGFTVDDVMDEYGWNLREVNQAIHDLRTFLADSGDTINLPCDPQGSRARWLYRLVGSLDDVRGWTANRVGDSETRVRTMAAMLTSIVAATSGRTTAGKKARIMERQLRRLVEDLDDIGAMTNPNGP